MEKKGTPASPATALASSVLPVPGEPTSRAPLGSRAPMAVYLPGLWRKSMISSSDSLASSWPATSLKVTPVDFSIYTLALALPTLPMPPMPPPFLDKTFMNSMKRPTIRMIGST